MTTEDMLKYGESLKSYTQRKIARDNTIATQKRKEAFKDIPKSPEETKKLANSAKKKLKKLQKKLRFKELRRLAQKRLNIKKLKLHRMKVKLGKPVKGNVFLRPI